MNIVFMTGEHPRHQYIARKLDELGYLKGLVIQEREPFVPKPPDDLDDPHLRDLYRHHFERRSQAEKKFFGEAEKPDVEQIQLPEEQVDSSEMREFVNDIEHDLTLSYGITYLSDDSLDSLADTAWNIHGGLSPEYKGGITHFWPSYRLEPQMTGITLHELTKDLDGGSIVHESSGSLVEGDGIHELACRTVKEFTDNHLPKVINLFKSNNLRDAEEQKWHGKMWYGRDWRPDHLIPIYDMFDNEIVDMCLNGDIEGREPELYSQF